MLFDVDGIRESILQNLIPELELIPRPACLNLDNNNEISGSFEDTSKISSVNDDIEISQFQRNSMKIMIPNTPNADVGRNRPKTVHFINNGKSRMKKRTSKRFSVIKSLVPISSKVEPLTEIDVRQLHTNFRIKIMGIENLKMYSFDEESQMPLQRLHPTCITVEALLYTGCATLDSQKVTSPIALASKNIFHSYNENIR